MQRWSSSRCLDRHMPTLCQVQVSNARPREETDILQDSVTVVETAEGLWVVFSIRTNLPDSGQIWAIATGGKGGAPSCFYGRWDLHFYGTVLSLALHGDTPVPCYSARWVEVGQGVFLSQSYKGTLVSSLSGWGFVTGNSVPSFLTSSWVTTHRVSLGQMGQLSSESAWLASRITRARSLESCSLTSAHTVVAFRQVKN